MSIQTLISSVQEEADRRTPDVILAVLSQRREVPFIPVPRHDACKYANLLLRLADLYHGFTKSVLDPDSFVPILYIKATNVGVKELVLKDIRKIQEYLATGEMTGCGSCPYCQGIEAGEAGYLKMLGLATAAVPLPEMPEVKKKNPPPPGSSGTTKAGRWGDGDDKWSSHDGDSDFEWPVGGNHYVPRKPGLAALFDT